MMNTQSNSIQSIPQDDRANQPFARTTEVTCRGCGKVRTCATWTVADRERNTNGQDWTDTTGQCALCLDTFGADEDCALANTEHVVVDHEADALPQAMGRRLFPRPVNGPIRVQVSGPVFRARDPFVLTIEQRDAKLAHLVQPMMQLLFAAMKAHALGVVDAVSIEELPARIQTQLEADARAAINRQSGLYRSEAERAANSVMASAMRDLSFHFPHHNPVATPEEKRLRADAVRSLEIAINSQRLPELMLSETERRFSQPLSSSPRAQVVRTALSGGVR